MCWPRWSGDRAAASPLAEIDRLSIIGGSRDTQDAVGGLLGISPLAVANVLESLKASGIDVASMLQGSNATIGDSSHTS